MRFVSLNNDLLLIAQPGTYQGVGDSQSRFVTYSTSQKTVVLCQGSIDWKNPGIAIGLAESILSHHLNDPAKALRLRASFAQSVINHIPTTNWTIASAEIDLWLKDPTTNYFRNKWD
jgi:hypothetical protein